MNDSIIQITLDMQSMNCTPVVWLKKGDTARKIVITLSDGGFPYYISETSYAVFSATKPDGNTIFNNCVVEDNKIIYDITQQTTSVCGRMDCEVRIIGGDNRILTTHSFLIVVDDVITNEEATESSSEFTALSNLMSEVIKITKEEGAILMLYGATEETLREIRDKTGNMAGSMDNLMTEDTGKSILASIESLNESIKSGNYGGQAAQKLRYGFRVNKNDSNPATRVEYLFDAINMKPAKMDYSAGKFDYGSWGDVWFVKDNFPCMVRNDGTLAYKLHPNNYAIKIDGTDSDVANAAYAGNAMSAIPLCWVKRYTEGDYRYVIFCQSQYDNTYKAYAHTRPDGTISPYAYGPMYKGSMINNVLRSLSGKRPQSNTGAAAEKTAALANGACWGLKSWMFVELIDDLLTLMGKSTNLQATYGQGHSTGGSSADNFLDTGTLDNAGQFFGYSNTTNQVKVFHMEAPWAERWDRLEGMVYINGAFHVKPTPENGGFNFEGTGYTNTGVVGPATNGFVQNFVANEYGSFPEVISGSESTYECDYFYQNASGVRVPLRGGACDNGGACGRSSSCSNAAGNARWSLGGSPYLINPS